MSIFNRIFGGGKDEDAEATDSPRDETPKEDAPTDIDALPPELSNPAKGSPAHGAPLSSDSRYHPALTYTPPAGVKLPRSTRAETQPDELDTQPEQPAAPARKLQRATFARIASRGSSKETPVPPASEESAPASSSPRIKTEPMPKPPPPGAKKLLTPLPPGATTRARRPSKPLRRQTPVPRSSTPVPRSPTPRPQTASGAPQARPQAASGARKPMARPTPAAGTPPRAKTQPGSGLDELAAVRSPPPPVPPPPVPPTPEATPAGKSDGKIQVALDGMDTQQLHANMDTAFSDLENGNGNGNGPRSVEATEQDLEKVRELFEDMAADYMARVRDFMMEVKWGEATPSWAGRCEPVVRSLRRFADKVGHKELSDRLKAYGAQLASTRRAGGAHITGEPAAALIAAFEALAELTPTVFQLDNERDRREPVIVESLLRQVPVRRVGLDRLHAVGLHKLEAFFRAKPDDMASLADIPLDAAQQICSCFASYKEQSDASLSAADVNAEHRRLKALVAELRREHESFERAARQWSAEAIANKRHYRITREQVLLKIQVSLARLGGLDTLDAIQRQSYERKLELLQSYLAQATAAGLGRKSTSTGGGDEQRP